MIDRQDIDALLIGALYGELTPSDESRLTAHLESHPTDRSALEGLRTTREAVRESRILAIQLDPPQSISALLLQEAARRAPKVAKQPEREEGWFARFVRSFAAHPAMAAAAMLVLVVGVGGLLYARQGNKFAESTVDESAVAAAPETASMGSGSAAPATVAIAGADAALDYRNADSMRVDLADGYGQKQAIPGGVQVTTPDPTVKDFDQKAKDSKDSPKVAMSPKPEPKTTERFEAKKPAPAKSVTKGAPSSDDLAESRNTKNDTFATTGSAVNAVSGAGSAAPPPPQIAQEEQKKESGANTLLAWAKDQHAQATKLARNGQCAEAGKVAAAISSKVPEYYNTNVATDRDLKKCVAYINELREREAEAANKSRAQKRIDANEPSPAPSK